MKIFPMAAKDGRLKQFYTPIRSNKAYFNDNDALAIFCRKTNTPFLRDRFGYLNQFSKINISEQNDIFPSSNFTKTLEELMITRATIVAQLIKESNKKLYVLWSGGVDSTSILLAMLAVLDRKDYERFGIVHTESSIEEYPKLYKYLKTINIELYQLDGSFFFDEWYKVAEEHYVISGYPADQLFGSIIHQDYPGLYFTDWRDWIKEKIAIEQFSNAFNYYNLPITTFGEFTWFMNFSTRWHIVNKDILRHIGKQESNTINFFDTKEFQDWSVSNFDKLHRYDQNNAKYYKLELKQFCNKIFPDNDYYLNKGKVDSTTYAIKSGSSLYIKVNPFIIIEEDNNIYKIDYPYSNIDNKDTQKYYDTFIRRIIAKYRK